MVSLRGSGEQGIEGLQAVGRSRDVEHIALLHHEVGAGYLTDAEYQQWLTEHKPKADPTQNQQ